MKVLRLLALVLVVNLVGCASTYIVPTDQDTYKAMRHAPAFFWGTPYGTEEEVYNEANKLCAKENKKVETIKLEIEKQFPGHSGGVSLEFRCE